MARRGRGMMRGMAGDAGWAVKPGEANGAAAQSIPGKRQTGRAEPRRRRVRPDWRVASGTSARRRAPGGTGQHFCSTARSLVGSVRRMGGVSGQDLRIGFGGYRDALGVHVSRHADVFVGSAMEGPRDG